MLKFFYENPPKLNHFIPRKLEISAGQNLLFGSPFSGKTSLGLAFLDNFSNSLYVDLKDLRLERELSARQINDFVAKNDIKALCVDNAGAELDESFKCANTLIISTSKDFELKGFKKHFLLGLDFEEFVAFSKNTSESMIFSHFMSAGNSPAQSELKYSILANTSELARNILRLIAQSLGRDFSILAAFGRIKEQGIKTSKDSFYATFESLLELGLIFGVKNFLKTAKFKRYYFGNFALRNLFAHTKNPREILLNMVFCELAKNGKEVYFFDEFDFYLKESKVGILVLPFLSADLALLKAKKLANDEINEIIIISNAPEQGAVFGQTSVRLLGFPAFAAGYLENYL